MMTNEQVAGAFCRAERRALKADIQRLQERLSFAQVHHEIDHAEMAYLRNELKHWRTWAESCGAADGYGWAMSYGELRRLRDVLKAEAERLKAERAADQHTIDLMDQHTVALMNRIERLEQQLLEVRDYLTDLGAGDRECGPMNGDEGAAALLLECEDVLLFEQRARVKEERMDINTGKVYASREEALRAGVPPDNAVEVESLKATQAALAKVVDVVRVVKGPFKGRVYQRLPQGGCRRRRDLEKGLVPNEAAR